MTGKGGQGAGRQRWRIPCVGMAAVWALLWLCVAAGAQDTVWRTYNDKGTTLFKDGEYAKAERLLLEAVAEGEKFGAYDKRLLTSLRVLADCYRAQGKQAEADLIDKRVVSILEKIREQEQALKPASDATAGGGAQSAGAGTDERSGSGAAQSIAAPGGGETPAGSTAGKGPTAVSGESPLPAQAAGSGPSPDAAAAEKAAQAVAGTSPAAPAAAGAEDDEFAPATGAGQDVPQATGSAASTARTGQPAPPAAAASEAAQAAASGESAPALETPEPARGAELQAPAQTEQTASPVPPPEIAALPPAAAPSESKGLGQVKQLKGHLDLVRSVAFAGDGKRALSGSGDQSLKLWDLEAGNEIRNIPA
ncbi:MAG TPA: tetratricopeptide repeat protein, partial [Candidatus Obscuribacterales bacterium]